MKLNKLFIISLVALPLLVACTSSVYVPKHSYPGDPFKDETSEGGGGGEGDIDIGEENMTVNFYKDYSHSDEPLYTMRWYMLVPLKECPEQAKLTDADAEDPLYGHFLGYSEYSSSIDESKLWNFETDYKQSNVLNLYGIWVSKQEVRYERF